MAVYDVNGDGLNDVVTALQAHGWGLAWYEQKRDPAGKISFVEHMIIDDFWTKKRRQTSCLRAARHRRRRYRRRRHSGFHRRQALLVAPGRLHRPRPLRRTRPLWFKTVRNPKAPGGAEFVPELIHNRSGAGNAVLAVDLNHDGAVDIITSEDRGTFIFWGKPKGKNAVSGSK